MDSRSGPLIVKRCVPFLDALTSGWIAPLAATIRLARAGFYRALRASSR